MLPEQGLLFFRCDSFCLEQGQADLWHLLCVIFVSFIMRCARICCFALQQQTEKKTIKDKQMPPQLFGDE